jgi:lipoate-protein ligase A
MALDEAVSEAVRDGSSPPTLRLYGWTVPSVSIGRFQRAGDVDLAFCNAGSVPVVRRPTGGRAILHGEELTYSFSAPSSLECLGEGLHGAYSTLSAAFLLAFGRLGVSAIKSVSRNRQALEGNPLCFGSASFGELTVHGRKIIGSAQRRWPEGFLQQGSVPLRLDRVSMRKVFRGQGGAWIDKRMAGVAEINGSVSLDVLRDAIVEGIFESLGLEAVTGPPGAGENERARRLVLDKYGSQEWTLLR